MLDSINSDPDLMNTIITGDESCVYGYDPETKSFCHFPCNEKPTRALNTTSLKCCLPSTDAIGNNPRKLLNIIIENNEIKIKDLPLLIFLYPIKVLNSL